MNICVTGSSGLVGTALTRAVRQRGDTTTALRRGSGPAGLSWNPSTYALADPAGLEGFDALVHLAGEPIAGRWTRHRKARIRSSRVNSTAMLARQLAGLNRPPRVWVVASAIGYYGSRGDEVLTEASSPGTGFLAEVCRDWEAAAEPARAVDIRVAHLRFGMLLSPDGGALQTMLPPFRWGLGGPLGSGLQHMSWATLADAVRALLFVLDQDDLSGPVNVTAPHPCTNREFTKALGHVLRRPAVMRVPAPLIRLLLGEMGDGLLLASQRVHPRQLQEHGFVFNHDRIEQGLESTLT